MKCLLKCSANAYLDHNFAKLREGVSLKFHTEPEDNLNRVVRRALRIMAQKGKVNRVLSKGSWYIA